MHTFEVNLNFSDKQKDRLFMVYLKNKLEKKSNRKKNERKKRKIGMSLHENSVPQTLFPTKGKGSSIKNERRVDREREEEEGRVSL